MFRIRRKQSSALSPRAGGEIYSTKPRITIKGMTRSDIPQVKGKLTFSKSIERPPVSRDVYTSSTPGEEDSRDLHDACNDFWTAIGYATDPNIKLLSHGVNGGAYKESNKLNSKLYSKLYNVLNYRVGKLPRHALLSLARSGCVIKVVNMNERDGVGLRECLTEARLHDWLQNQCATVDGHKVYAADVIPKFFFGGMVDIYLAPAQKHWHILKHDALKTVAYRRIFVQVISLARGVPVDTIPKHKLNSRQYVAIEKAIETVWLCGVVHLDLHSRNILIDTATNKVTILDFGFAQLVPKTILSKVRSSHPSKTAADAIWYSDGLDAYGKTAMELLKPRLEWFNPNGKFMRYYRQGVINKDKIQEQRQIEWQS